MPGLLSEYVYGKQGPFGLRQDGTQKGYGYFGELPDYAHPGMKMTELSANVDGVEFPLIAPTLSPGNLFNLQIGGQPSRETVMKAFEWAMKRKKQGKSPFAD